MRKSACRAVNVYMYHISYICMECKKYVIANANVRAKCKVKSICLPFAGVFFSNIPMDILRISSTSACDKNGMNCWVKKPTMKGERGCWKRVTVVPRGAEFCQNHRSSSHHSCKRNLSCIKYESPAHCWKKWTCSFF